MTTDLDDLFPNTSVPPRDEPTITTWCPGCGAYLFTFGLTGPYQCDQCGCEWEDDDG